MAAKRYVISYAFEDAGRGTSPAVFTLEGDKALREWLARILEWMPEAIRSQAVDKLMKEATYIHDLHMESFAEDYIDEETVKWEDLGDDFDTEAVLNVRLENRPASNPGQLKRRLT